MALARIDARVIPATDDERMRFNDRDFPLRVNGPWGSYERRFSGHGLVAEHLRILPPDGDDRSRLAWHLSGIWPYVGFFLGIAAAVAAHHVASVEVSTAIGAIVWLAPWVWMTWRARPYARRVRDQWRLHDASTWLIEPSALRDSARRLDAAGTASSATLKLVWCEEYDASLDASARDTETLHMNSFR